MVGRPTTIYVMEPFDSGAWSTIYIYIYISLCTRVRVLCTRYVFVHEVVSVLYVARLCRLHCIVCSW